MAPLLRSDSVLLCSSAFTVAYLGAIYLLPSTRISLPASSKLARTAPQYDASTAVPAVDPLVAQPPAPDSPPRDRNHPAVIRARLVAVSAASLASCAAVPLLLLRADSSAAYRSWRAALPAALRLLGFSTPTTAAAGTTTTAAASLARLVLYPLGLTASLFAGSFYVSALAGELPGQSGARTWATWRNKFDGWRGIRTYLVGPLTEELTFRSCIVAVSALAGWSPAKIIFLTPLWFGIAHVHHAWETYVAGGRTRQALIRGALQSTFQFAYTTIFGWYATFLFLRTGSVVPPFLAHVVCNVMGIPPLDWALHVFPDRKKSLIGAYLSGIAAFSYGFWRWTAPALLFGAGAEGVKWAYAAAV